MVFSSPYGGQEAQPPSGRLLALPAARASCPVPLGRPPSLRDKVCRPAAFQSRVRFGKWLAECVSEAWQFQPQGSRRDWFHPVSQQAQAPLGAGCAPLTRCQPPGRAARGSFPAQFWGLPGWWPGHWDPCTQRDSFFAPKVAAPLFDCMSELSPRRPCLPGVGHWAPWGAALPESQGICSGKAAGRVLGSQAASVLGPGMDQEEGCEPIQTSC